MHSVAYREQSQGMKRQSRHYIIVQGVGKKVQKSVRAGSE